MTLPLHSDPIVASPPQVGRRRPRIAHTIAEYLNLRGIASWMATCKTFSRDFALYQWLHPSIKSSAPQDDAILCDKQRTQTLHA
jgi:hypothetical protein